MFEDAVRGFVARVEGVNLGLGRSFQNRAVERKNEKFHLCASAVHSLFVILLFSEHLQLK